MRRTVKFLTIAATNIVLASSPAFAQQPGALNDPSILCVADQLPTSIGADGAPQMDVAAAASININQLAETCQQQHGWTERQAVAASLYAGAGIQVAMQREAWSKTGLPFVLPDRVKQQMTVSDLISLMIEFDATRLNQVLKKELAVSGSVLNPDGTIDDMTVKQSEQVGVPIGGIMVGMFIREDMERIFASQDYNASELFGLLNGIAPEFAAIIERLK